MSVVTDVDHVPDVTAVDGRFTTSRGPAPHDRSSLPAEAALRRASEGLTGVGLDELGTTRDLQNRFDRKRLLPSETYAQVADLAADHRVLAAGVLARSQAASGGCATG